MKYKFRRYIIKQRLHWATNNIFRCLKVKKKRRYHFWPRQNNGELLATQYFVVQNISFLDLGNENQVSSPNVICNYNSAMKLNFRRLISLEFILQRRNLIFVAECNEYGRFFINIQVMKIDFRPFLKFRQRKSNFVAQCNL